MRLFDTNKNIARGFIKILLLLLLLLLLLFTAIEFYGARNYVDHRVPIIPTRILPCACLIQTKISHAVS